jgi:hypothetical protein
MNYPAWPVGQQEHGAAPLPPVLSRTPQRYLVQLDKRYIQ